MDELHREVVAVTLFGYLVDTREVRVVEHAEHATFIEKQHARVRIGSAHRIHDFDGTKALVARLSQVDIGHPALRQQPQ